MTGVKMKNVDACKKTQDNKKCYYIVQGFDLEYYKGKDIGNLKKKMTEPEMVKYAKSTLKFEHERGQEKETKINNLTQPINAWIFLKDLGLGVKTNCKQW